MLTLWGQQENMRTGAVGNAADASVNFNKEGNMPKELKTKKVPALRQLAQKMAHKSEAKFKGKELGSPQFLHMMKLLREECRESMETQRTAIKYLLG